MTTILTRVAILIFILWITTQASCNKNCVESKYSFKIGIKASPNLDSINLNDTIWLEVNESTTLKDLSSDNIVDYSNASNLGTAISFGEFIGGSVSNPGGIPAVNAFNYNLITGKEFVHYLPAQTKEFNFDESQGRYKFKLGVIAKRKGIFSISISNAANVYSKNDKCTKASFAINLKETNNHIYFLEQNRPGYIPSGLELTNMYCFKVK